MIGEGRALPTKSILEGIMSARVVIAWILTILAVLLGSWALFGYEFVRSAPVILVPGVAVLALVAGGLVYVMARGKFGEWGRVLLAAAAFVVGLACVAASTFLEAVSTL